MKLFKVETAMVVIYVVAKNFNDVIGQDIREVRSIELVTCDLLIVPE